MHVYKSKCALFSALYSLICFIFPLTEITEPTRNVELPQIPQNLDRAIGANGRSVIVKKSIFVKNNNNNPELTADDNRRILQKALYETTLYGQTQPITRPDYQVAIYVDDLNSIVVLDLFQQKENVEIVGWRFVDKEGLEKMKRQATREDGQLLILSPNNGSAAGQYGNALIGIYDDSDNLLWSFHIWCPEDNPTTLPYTQTNSGETYNLMNMPIGATKALTLSSSDDDKVKGFGLYYQWGRKDPLGRANAIASDVIKPVYDKNGNAITLTDAAYVKNIDDVLAGYTDVATDGPKSHYMARYAIANPAVFLFVDDGQYSNNWAGEINNFFWGNSYPSGTYPRTSKIYKSIFDPSPAGYRVAPQDTWVNFTTTRANSTTVIATFNVVGNESFDWTNTNLITNRGYAFYYQGIGTGLTHFYGASGYRNRISGALSTVGTVGGSWSSAPSGVNASYLYFNATSVSPLSSNGRASGFPVRCVSE